MTPKLIHFLVGISAVGTVDADVPVDLFGLPETVTIATGREQSVKTAPAVATVITADDIRNYGIRNIVDALRLVPGMHQGLFQTYQSNVTVRGFSSLRSNNILFLLDGISQPDLLQGDQIAVLGTIPIDAIQRIEVTRGPGSSVFGADAFSAVVNIVTKTKTDGGQVALSGGTFNTGDARLLAGYNTKRLRVVLALEGMQTDGFSPLLGVDRQSVVDALMGTSASLTPAHANTSRKELGALMNLSYGETTGLLRLSRWNKVGLAGGLGGNLDPSGTLSYETVEGRLAHKIEFGSEFELTLTADALQTRQTFDNVMFLPPGAFGVFTDGARLSTEAQQQFLRLHADGRYEGFPGHFLTAGFGYEHGGFNVHSATLNYLLINNIIIPTPPTTYGSSGVGKSSRQLAYGYIQDEWSIAPKWTLTWGVRFDDYSDFGTQTSPRAVLVWTPRPEWTVKLLYGQGFRAPTLFETTPFPVPIYKPNPALVPERLRTAELSVDYTPKRDLAFRLNLFRHETDNQIRQQDRGLFGEPQNVGRQVGNGFEVEMHWGILRNLVFEGWYAYQYNVDETTHKDAGYSPHHRLFGSLQYTWGKAFFNLQGTYVGGRTRVAEDPRTRPANYLQVDLLTRYQFTKNLSLQLDVRNLLNSNMTEPAPGTSFPQDLPLPGRNYYVTLVVGF
ncbi:TonB-dependent receptor [uncultured Thiodictyon sp.]|uniref:TonB-dependent receptor plug domain-containing protein n=1 Tax=uncultured Thiodictyon sp. TaxID=1846217 RepID=UPI0025FB8B00|nr:TonB-dependent receptor [uncultured Thiodictyon sp.]